MDFSFLEKEESRLSNLIEKEKRNTVLKRDIKIFLMV